jgi:periplasmic protein TonB
MTTRNNLTDVAQRLIQHAAHKAPAALAARLEEEWLADLQSRSGSLSHLRLAIGCWWATAVITREFRVPQLAAAGAPKPLLGDLRPDLPRLSRRTVAFILIAAVHVLLIYAFTTGLAQHVVGSLPELTHAVFLDEIKAERPLPPPPDFKPVVIQPVLVDPVVPRTIDSLPDDSATPQTPTQAPQNPSRPVTPPTIARTWGGPGEGFPTTDEYYPAASRRLAEVGAATVGVCVDRQGRLTADPTLVATSGSRRLDAGALTLAKAGSGHYRPTTDDGQPVSACYAYRIRFKLD